MTCLPCAPVSWTFTAVPLGGTTYRFELDGIITGAVMPGLTIPNFNGVTATFLDGLGHTTFQNLFSTVEAHLSLTATYPEGGSFLASYTVVGDVSYHLPSCPSNFILGCGGTVHYLFAPATGSIAIPIPGPEPSGLLALLLLAVIFFRRKKISIDTTGRFMAP